MSYIDRMSLPLQGQDYFKTFKLLYVQNVHTAHLKDVKIADYPTKSFDLLYTGT